jgi:peptidylprolyl isomerase
MRISTTVAAFFCAVAVGSAQAPTAPPPVPADVAAPPADAATTSSGLASRMVSPGSGTDKVAPTDVVTVHYTGWTPDG